MICLCEMTKEQVLFAMGIGIAIFLLVIIADIIDELRK